MVEATAKWQDGEDEEDRVAFPLLSDADNAVCKAYGVFDRAHDHALPAVFVVSGRDGSIRFAQVGTTIRDRARIEDLLALNAPASAASRTPS